MYAFVILRLDHIPDDIAVKLQPGGDRTHDIFNKHGVIIRLFSYELFVRTLEQGINFIYSALLNEGYQILNPEKFFEAPLNAHKAALIVGAVIADFL